MLTTLRRRPYLIVLIAVLVIAAWLAFRPELLFVNKSVDEPFPAASASSTTSVNKQVLKGTSS